MKHKKRIWIQMISVPGIVTMCAVPGYSAAYLSVEQAQTAIFPGEQMQPVSLNLTGEQQKEIKNKSGVPARVKEQRIWKTSSGGFFIVDEAVGKHEFITYAIGINPDGSVKQIEIMEYKETYGYEIREEDWRAQFKGKTSNSHLKLEDDIKNISGATLSCRHITDGVKRVLTMYELYLKGK